MAEVPAEGEGGSSVEPPDADDDKEKYVEMDPSGRYGRVRLAPISKVSNIVVPLKPTELWHQGRSKWFSPSSIDIRKWVGKATH